MSKGTVLQTLVNDNPQTFCLYDIGELFGGKGKPNGRVLPGWVDPQPYTPPKRTYAVASTADRVLDTVADVVAALSIDEAVYVFGPTGCGKTAALKHIASLVNWPVYEVTGHSRLEFPELCGAYHVVDGSMVWHDGPLAAAMRNGGMLLINELDLLDPSTAAGLNSVLDGSPLFVPELNEYIPRHPMFRFAATGNTSGGGDTAGMYLGTLRQNAALMGRFWSVEAGYLPVEAEVRYIMSTPLQHVLPQDLVEKCCEYAAAARCAFITTSGGDGSMPDSVSARAGSDMPPLTTPVTTRDMLRWCKGIALFRPLSEKLWKNAHVRFDAVLEAARRAFINRADPASRVGLEDLYKRLFGTA